MKTLGKTFLGAVLVAALLIGLASPSHATYLEMTISDGVGDSATFTDLGGTPTYVGNVVPISFTVTPGNLVYVGTIGKWTTNTISATTYPTIGYGSTSAPVVGIVANDTAGSGNTGTLTITVTAEGFIPTIAPQAAAFTATDNGSLSATFEALYSTSAGNTSLASLAFTPTTNPSSLAGDAQGVVTGASNPYTLTTVATIKGRSDRNALITAETTVDPVPEPGTVLFLGLTLLGAAFYGRRFKRGDH
jgi:hypothetical protein